MIVHAGFYLNVCGLGKTKAVTDRSDCYQAVCWFLYGDQLVSWKIPKISNLGQYICASMSDTLTKLTVGSLECEQRHS